MTLLILSVLCPWSIFFRHCCSKVPCPQNKLVYLLLSLFSCKEKRIHEALENNDNKVFFEGVVIITGFVRYPERGDFLWLVCRHYCDIYIHLCIYI